MLSDAIMEAYIPGGNHAIVNVAQSACFSSVLNLWWASEDLLS